GRGGLVHDRVLRCAARLEREVEPRQSELEPGDVRREHAQCFFEQFLSGFVPLEDDDRLPFHPSAFHLPGLGLPPRGYTGNSMARRGGWRRLGSRGRFRYVDSRGRPIRDEAALERIDTLRIPPAWR